MSQVQKLLSLKCLFCIYHEYLFSASTREGQRGHMPRVLCLFDGLNGPYGFSSYYCEI